MCSLAAAPSSDGSPAPRPAGYRVSIASLGVSPVRRHDVWAPAGRGPCALLWATLGESGGPGERSVSDEQTHGSQLLHGGVGRAVGPGGDLRGGADRSQGGGGGRTR